MNYNYDGDNREADDFPPRGEPRETPGNFGVHPPETGESYDRREPERIIYTPYTPVNSIPDTHGGAPEYNSSVTEPETPEPSGYSYPVRGGVPQEPPFNPPADGPIARPQTEMPGGDAGEASHYSEARLSEVSDEDMFTPGIHVMCGSPREAKNGRYHRNGQSGQRGDAPPARRGGFLRAACLVLACAVFSAAATYGVIEYKARTAAPAVNQVVLGGIATPQPEGYVLSPTAAQTGAEMPAQDIYTMACSQVVGIKTEVTLSGGWFNESGTTTAVSGSGFIISSDGYILTNYHVVETAYTNNLPLLVYLNDGTRFEAKVIGFESSNDVAVIKINATGLSAASIANSDDIRVGERVYAVGNPFGELVYTMTEGIVSALDRVVSVEKKSINTFQLSAAVNSGNSGGPVYDSKGEVVGIVTAKFMDGTVEGIGFAIPINDAIEIASELIENGYITGRAFIGITVASVTSAAAEYYGWVEGAYVRSVTAGSAADKAGLQVGDIIIKMGDDAITSDESLLFTKKKFRAGDTTAVTVWRMGQETALTITFDEDLSAGQPQLSADQPQLQQPQEQPQQRPPYQPQQPFQDQRQPQIVIPMP